MSFYTTKYLSIARKTLDSHLQLLFFLTKHLQPPPPPPPLFLRLIAAQYIHVVFTQKQKHYATH